jgi:hypothetical protein
MPQGYASRDLTDPNQMKKNKQSMADLKLRRLTELNNRLREDLERERIPVSQAAKRYVCCGSGGEGPSQGSSNTDSLQQHHRIHQHHSRFHGSFSLGTSRQEG